MSLNSTLTEESLYSVDWLKVVVHVNHNQHKLNNGVRVDIKRIDGGYDTEGQMESFRPMWICKTGSYSSSLKVKSLSLYYNLSFCECTNKFLYKKMKFSEKKKNKSEKRFS